MIWLGGFGRLDPRVALVAGVWLALPIALTPTTFALERTGRAPIMLAQNDNAEKLDTLKQHEEELKSVRDQQRKSIETEASIKRDIDQIGTDRRKLNQDLIDTAARLRGIEAKIAATQDRIKPLDENEQSIRKSLEGRRAVIGEVLAALQRIGRRPPPALIATPEDALQSVRTAMVLGAVLPEMRHEVEALANDLSELLAVRKKINVETDQLKAEVALLDAGRARVNALVDERQKQLAEREKALDAERARAGNLARQVDNLKDLIAKLEQGLDPAAREGSNEPADANKTPAAAESRAPDRGEPTGE